MLHRLPDEIDTIDYEDALRLLALCQLESEELEKKTGKSGGETTERTVYKPKARR